jgi:hypothetical protein
VWLTMIDSPELRLLLPRTKNPDWHFLAWAPNGRWLILKKQTAEGAALALFNIAAEQLMPVDVSCPQNCHIELSWGEQSVWVSTDTLEDGCLYEVEPVIGEEALKITYGKCLIGPWALHPTSPRTLPDGWVAFVNRGCGKDCQGPAPGLYFLGPEDAAPPIALLDEAEGTALWTEDASAFLYFNPEGIPTHLGVTDTAASASGFWDVRRTLDGAHAFQWGAVVTVDSSQ